MVGIPVLVSIDIAGPRIQKNVVLLLVFSGWLFYLFAPRSTFSNLSDVSIICHVLTFQTRVVREIRGHYFSKATFHVYY